MRTTRIVSICASLGIVALGLLSAQEQRVSPHDQTSATIAGKKITVTYGRPSMKGREIFGDLVPYGEVWRTGADEATTLTTEGELMIGDIKVPAGSYSVFTIPNEDQWTLIVNNEAKQFGAFKYDQTKDLGRTPMQVESSPASTETFTISIEPKEDNQGELKMMWAGTVVRVPLKVVEAETMAEPEPE